MKTNPISRKSLVRILALSLTCFMLAGCGGTGLSKTQAYQALSTLLHFLAYGAPTAALFILVYRIYRSQKGLGRLSPKKQPFGKPQDVSAADGLEKAVLLRLRQFEDERRFLASNLTKAALASFLNTNPKYAATILVNHRGKNIVDYVNDLRVDYIAERLRSDPKFRQFTQIALAEETGFGSVSSLVRAFRSRMGVNLSEFMESLPAGGKP